MKNRLFIPGAPMTANQSPIVGRDRKGRPVFAIAGGAKSSNELLAERADRVEKNEALRETAVTEERDFTDEEWAEFNARDAEIEKLDGDIANSRKLEKSEQRGKEIAELRKGETASVEVTSEPAIYSADAERRGTSFLRDLAHQARDPQAADRLRRHQAQADDALKATGQEFRDVGTGAFAGLTVPQYLTELVAPVRRAGRPFADACNHHDLPADGMTVNISRITTGTAVGFQATENTGVTETNADDTLLTVNVRTIAGMQDVSRQAIDRSVGVDAIVVEDLVRAYNTKLDNSIINDDGTSGTHLGVLSTSSIQTVTYTDGNPTAAEAWPKLWDLTQKIQASYFGDGPDYFLMNPRRFWWFVSQVGTSFPFVNVEQSTVQGGSVDSKQYGTIQGRLGPVPVLTDANVPTTLTTGGASAADIVIGVTAPECHLWEEPNAPLRIRTDETLADQLSVRFVVYGYSAFTAGRYPGAQGTISGTGLEAPTF